jgi:hypothetical protein
LRKLLIGALAGAVVLAVAAVAMATTTQTFTHKYTSKKTSTSVGTSFATTSTESDNEDHNHQPKATRQFNITFPAGTKVDTSAAPICKKLDEGANDPCPKNTNNRKNGLFLYVVAPGQAPVVLKPAFKGLTLKTATPPNCIASTNQNGHCVDSSGNPGTEAVLSEFDLKTKPATKGKGKKKKTFLKTPSKCTKAGWVFKAEITYDDGSKVKPESVSPCKK